MSLRFKHVPVALRLPVCAYLGRRLLSALQPLPALSTHTLLSSAPILPLLSSFSLSHMLLLKDLNGRRIYKDINELATAMLVNRIVPVP